MRREILGFTIGVIAILIIIAIVTLTDFFVEAVVASLVLSTVLTAISSIGTYMQAVEARRQREEIERPLVNIYFKPEGGLLNCAMQNFGTLAARNIEVKFNPSPIRYTDDALSDTSLFATPYSFLPPRASYHVVMGASHSTLELNQDVFEVHVSYESMQGKKYSEITVVNFGSLSDVKRPPPPIEDTLVAIKDELAKLNKSLSNKPVFPSL